jgi:hypothetical protein
LCLSGLRFTLPREPDDTDQIPYRSVLPTKEGDRPRPAEIQESFIIKYALLDLHRNHLSDEEIMGPEWQRLAHPALDVDRTLGDDRNACLVRWSAREAARCPLVYISPRNDPTQINQGSLVGRREVDYKLPNLPNETVRVSAGLDPDADERWV